VLSSGRAEKDSGAKNCWEALRTGGGTMALGNTELAASIIESVISPDEV
jgi:hypothetical protein